MVRRPLVTVVLMFAALFGTMTLFKYVPKIFFPDSDRPTFESKLNWYPVPPSNAPPKSCRRSSATCTIIFNGDRTTRRNRQCIGAWRIGWCTALGIIHRPRWTRYYLGANPGTGQQRLCPDPRSAHERAAMEHDMATFADWAADNLPEAKVDLAPRSMGPAVKYPVQFRLAGKNARELFHYVDVVKAKLRTVPQIGTVVDDWGIRSKKLVVRIDQARARRAGVTSQDVATSMRAHFSGLRVSDFREDEHVIPVVMRATEADRDDLSKLETYRLPLKEAEKAYRCSRSPTLSSSGNHRKFYAATGA